MKTWLVSTCVLLAASAAHADTTYGSVISIERIEPVTPDASPYTAQIQGAFLSWNGASYDAGARGTVRLVCPAGKEAQCKAQLAALVDANAKGQCAAMGWDIAPLPTSGDATWPVLRGVSPLAADDPLCARAKAVPVAPAVVAAPIVVPPVPKRQKEKIRWYGGYTLMVDAINIATAPAFIGIGGYFVAAPIVHVSHREYVRAALSLSIRVAFPLLGFSAACSHGCGGDNGVVGFVGVGGGALLAMLVDATMLSYTAKPEKPSQTAFAPYPMLDRTTAGLGFAGAF